MAQQNDGKFFKIIDHTSEFRKLHKNNYRINLLKLQKIRYMY